MMYRIIIVLLSIVGTIGVNACVELKDPTNDAKENTNRLQTALDSYDCVNVTEGVWSTSGITIGSNTRLILNEQTRIEAKINVTQTAVVRSSCVRL